MLMCMECHAFPFECNSEWAYEAMRNGEKEKQDVRMLTCAESLQHVQWDSAA